MRDYGIPLETPLGTVWLVPTDATHISVDANSDGKTLTVRGVSHPVHLHVYRTGCIGDGESTWNIRAGWENRSDTHFGGRWTGTKYVDATDAFRRKVLAEVVPLVEAWANANEDKLVGAECTHLRGKVSTITREIAELERKLDEKHVEREVLLNAERDARETLLSLP